jgi:hypothetical protein
MSVLEFISSIKWPIVALILLGVIVRGVKKSPSFGQWLRDWLDRRDVSGKAGPLEFQAMSKAAVEQAAAVSAASDAEINAIAAASETQAVLDPELMGYDTAELRREFVEDLMRASAQWGWEMAQMGFRTPPDPQVRWTDDGRPQIMFGAGTAITRALVTPAQRVLTPAEVARRAAAAPEPEISNEDRQAAIQRRLEALRREESGG